MGEQRPDANPTKPFRVLALDGGGMRGLYSATVLDTLASQFAAQRQVERLDVGRGFDLIVGTSTGGILACGLAAGLSTTAVIELYRTAGPRIFSSPVPRSKPRFACWALTHLGRPANDNVELRQALRDTFGDATLGSIFAKRRIALCVPCVNVSTGRSWVFKTPHSLELTRDRGFKLVDVCLATTAAPIYFPLSTVINPEDPGHQLMFVDGGLWANNPVLIGIVEALELSDEAQPIEVLSIGTCPPPPGTHVPIDETRWGLYRWKAGAGVLQLALDSQAWGHSYIASRLAEALRKLNRECRVIRMPHTAPSSEQARHLALDSASDTTLRILTDLGKQDADFDQPALAVRTTGIMKALTRMFSAMPPWKTSSDLDAVESRRSPRVQRGDLFEGGYLLIDESAAGAGFVADDPPPEFGEVFDAIVGDQRIRGRVVWFRRLDDKRYRFGITKDPVEKAREAG